MVQLTPAFQYFAEVSQRAITIEPPHRGLVSMLHFGDYVLVKSEIACVIQRRWFFKEMPIFYYHLPKEIRLPLVAQMYNSGCKAIEIAEIVGLSQSTISNDLKELKNPERASLFVFSPKTVDNTPKDLVLKSTINQKQRNFNPANANWLV